MPGSPTVGGDGLLYVMNTGELLLAAKAGSRSWIPLGRTELASFAGFGTGPGNVAADGERGSS